MEYVTMFFILLAAYGVFRAASWVFLTAIKLAFTIAFLALGVIAMSSTVGLL